MGDHYLPQMLLKHFCDGDGFLWVARKGQDQPFRTTPRNVFAENDLYTKHHPRRQSRRNWMDLSTGQIVRGCSDSD